MGPNFKEVRYSSPTSVDVTGEFDTHADVIDDVIIRVLVIPEGTPNDEAVRKPMVGEARVADGAATTTPPLTTSPPFPTGRDNDNDTLTTGTFSASVTVPPTATYTVIENVQVRVIGISVAIKRPEDAVTPDPQDPPGFETYTWCVSRKVAPAT